MEIIDIHKPEITSWALESNAGAGSNGQKHAGHALAEVISDMVLLSQKIDLFCLRFEFVRRGQCRRKASPQEIPTSASQTPKL